MKTAVSIPDEVFERADKLAEKLNLSRSGLYAIALQSFIRAHEQASITEWINTFIEENGQPYDAAFLNGSLKDMQDVEW